VEVGGRKVKVTELVGQMGEGMIVLFGDEGVKFVMVLEQAV
jgi:hypothetical protein